MRILLGFWFLNALFSVAKANGARTDCLRGIVTVIWEFVFTPGNPDDYYGNLCQNNLSTISMWSAAKLYCTPHEIEAGSELIGGWCTEYGDVELRPYSSVAPMLTDDFISGLPVVEFSDVNETVVWDHAVLISKTLFTTGFKTTTIFENSYLLDSRYGWGVYGFWGSLLLSGIIHRFFDHIFTSRRASSHQDIEGSGPTSSKSSSGIFGSAYHWVRTNLIIPAAIGTHHQRLYLWCNIPTRIETIVVLSYWLLTLVLCAVSYYIFTPNLYYSAAQQRWRYIADRTGVMSYANLPILWMFSGRNNVFLWLTGWSFSTFNIFHRHVARVATILAIIHSICYTGLEWDYLASDWKEKYWYMGAMATVTMSFLLLFSSIWLRKKAYEVFLILHIVFSVLTLVGLYYHTEIWDGEYDPYLWPPVAIWSVDRLARIVRQLYCNLHVRFSSQLSSTQAVVTYHKDANLLKLEITPGSTLLKASAGQHYFLYQPLKWKGWENHPFTLAGWKAAEANDHDGLADKNRDTTPASDSRDLKGADKEIQISPVSASSSEPDSSRDASLSLEPEQRSVQASSRTARDTLIFYVRPYSSWTQRLRNECNKSATGSINARFLIEGPYGHRSPVHSYETVVFIVGGTGIAGALPYLQEHLLLTSGSSHADSSSSPRPSGTRTRQITLIWTAKQSAMIRHAAATELKPFLSHADITTHFFATSRSESPVSVQSDNLEKVNSVDHGLGLAISYGRPNVGKSIDAVISAAHNGTKASGQVAVLTCGPAAMADDARAAVHRALKDGRRGVGYFEETFGW